MYKSSVFYIDEVRFLTLQYFNRPLIFNSWKAKEAALFVIGRLLGDFLDVERSISPESAHGFAEYAKFAIQQGLWYLEAVGMSMLTI